MKLPEEVAIQQYCNDIGSAAHVELMRYAKVRTVPGNPYIHPLPVLSIDCTVSR